MRLLRSALVACALVACIKTDDLRVDRTRETPSTRPPTEEDPPIADHGFCENGSLSFGPSSLPPAIKGQPYEARVKDHAEDGWSGTSYDGSSLPPGLALEGEKGDFDPLVLTGVPTESGRFEITISANHALTSDGCSTMPDPHRFELEVYETDPDAGFDAGLDSAQPDGD